MIPMYEYVVIHALTAHIIQREAPRCSFYSDGHMPEPLTLVRELLGLDVVLVHYPGHMATAVAFDETVKGDYFEINGRRFTICDPTYINADIGMAMTQFKSTPAEIIKL